MTIFTIVLIVLCQIFEDGPGPIWPLEGKREYHALTRSITITIISTITTNMGKHCKTQGDAGERGVQESPSSGDFLPT